jgi:hypothetical protein
VITSKTGRVRFEDAAKDLVNDYNVNNRKSLDELERRINLHLAPYFGTETVDHHDAGHPGPHREAPREFGSRFGRPSWKKRSDGMTVEVSPALTKPVSNDEINRELTALKWMFTLAIQAGQILYRPHIAMLQEAGGQRPQ